MKMVAHQAIRVHLDSGPLAGLTQKVEETYRRVSRSEDRLTRCTSIHDVIEPTNSFISQRSPHAHDRE